MVGVSDVQQYMDEVRSLYASGHAREHAYRPPLQRLMGSFIDVEAINDPKQSEHGAPDFIFQRLSNRDIILGYAEAKDIDVNLDKVEKSDQMHRYAGYQNLYLTDYLEFRFFRDGEKYKTLRIGDVTGARVIGDPDQYERLYRELEEFISLPPQKITSGGRLAEIMGAKARRIRDDIISYFKESPSGNGELVKVYNLMRTMLVHDLDHEKFADMYAQTLVYGLFVARYNDPTPDTFNREEARALVPRTNPFLRQFFDHIVGPNFDVRLGRAVDELCEVFRVSDVKDIVHRHFGQNEQRDPIIHFYENFLKAYDPAVRKRMGAFYTPQPVVQYIVRSIDRVLKEEFGLAKGLIDNSTIVRNHRTFLTDPMTGLPTKKYKDERVEYGRVQILDPAVGTATFLNEVIRFIHNDFAKKGQLGRWPAYVNNSLVPRLNGFELMMAPYTIAHLKLGMTLAETGIDKLTSRLGVYLTNTLEEGVPYQPDLLSLLGLAEAVTNESVQAGRIKTERPVMVVLGNPPYAGVSSNETDFANGLITKYKTEPGGKQKLQERKHWLNDDYVKFIAFAEGMIARNGSGVVAMITNNGYLDNPTFRGMRWHLAKTFDKIFVLDLHGNSNKKETAPDGGKDENVFDIMQGVGIIIAVKSETDANELAAVYHAELYGTRQAKFKSLNADKPEFTKLTLDTKYLYFVPKSTDGKLEYDAGVSVNQLFMKNVTGIVTMGDGFIIDEDPDVLSQRVKKLADGEYGEAELKSEFSLGKNYAEFATGNASKLTFDPGKVVKIGYRPFDIRYTYFDNKVIWRWRESVMRNFIGHANVGLVTTRFQKDNPGAFVSESIIGHKVFNAYDSNSIFPLYLINPDGTRMSNLSPDQMAILSKNLTVEYSPEDILDYVYGVLYSPSYREKYAEYLKSDFPRVPAPLADSDFIAVGKFGHELRDLHLMKASTADDFSTVYPEIGDDIIESVTFKASKVWINQKQYFGGVSEAAWNLHIGGYQPAQKWLKDRRGRRLADTDLDYYQCIIRVLEETVRIMADLEKIDTAW